MLTYGSFFLRHRYTKKQQEAIKEKKGTKGEKSTKGKKDTLKSLFEKISRAELEEFIKTYMTKNKVF